MLTIFANALESKLSLLPYFDVWGGVVKPFERKKDDGSTQTVPLSCGQSYADCSNDPYRLITPDDSKMSLMYIEPVDDIDIEAASTNRSITTSFNLVVWLNLPKIGFADYCNAQAYFSMQLQKHLKKYKYRNGDGDIELEFTIASDLTDTLNPFEKFDFDSLRVILRPYTYIVLRINATGTIGLSCMDSYEPEQPIECYDEQPT